MLANSFRDLTVRVGPDREVIENRAFMNAALLLACEYGYGCGENNSRVLNACAFQGHCGVASLRGLPLLLRRHALRRAAPRPLPHDPAPGRRYRRLVGDRGRPREPLAQRCRPTATRERPSGASRPDRSPTVGVPMIKLTVNGRTHSVDVEPEMPLLWVLRDHLGLPGTKYGCGISQCGACTVHVDGEPVRSCIVTAAAGRRQEGRHHRGPRRSRGCTAIQKAWIEHEVPQCGYCQTGMIMSAAALLAKKPKPTDADIDEAMTNLCRCGTYARVRKAIHAAAAPTATVTPVRKRPEESRHDRPLSRRRDFLQASAAVGGGLCLEFSFPLVANAAAARPPPK